jgi:hypothetical protein
MAAPTIATSNISAHSGVHLDTELSDPIRRRVAGAIERLGG